MLTNSEEKIFLEAIDQYLEDESFEQMNIKTRKILFEDSNIKEEKEMESQVDKDKEADIEIMNIKFYEALNIDSNEIKDISTDFESEDNNLTNEKSFIKLSDCLILTKEFIENNKQKIFDEYKNQIILEEKIKNKFKKDEVNEKDVKNSDLNNEK